MASPESQCGTEDQGSEPQPGENTGIGDIPTNYHHDDSEQPECYDVDAFHPFAVPDSRRLNPS